MFPGLLIEGCAGNRCSLGLDGGGGGDGGLAVPVLQHVLPFDGGSGGGGRLVLLSLALAGLQPPPQPPPPPPPALHPPPSSPPTATTSADADASYPTVASLPRRRGGRASCSGRAGLRGSSSLVLELTDMHTTLVRIIIARYPSTILHSMQKAKYTEAINTFQMLRSQFSFRSR